MVAKRTKMKSKIFSYENENHAINLNNMRLNNKWCDVTIKVNEKEIHAHKTILAANLKYFDKMFSNEAFRELKKEVIVMDGVEGTDLEAFISYAYAGEILLTDRNVVGLLEVANYLGEDGIKDACIEFLKKHLKTEDSCRVYKFANIIGCLSLKDVAKAKILSNFESCSQTNDYLDFDDKHLTEILSDGKSQSILVQQNYFEGIMRWIMHDVKNRSKHAIGLLSLVELAKLAADDMIDDLYRKVVNHNDEYGILVKDVMFCYHKSKNRPIQVLLIVGFSNDQLNFQFCNFTEKKWVPLKSIPNVYNDLFYSAGAMLNDELYYVSSTINSKVFCLHMFNAQTQQTFTLHNNSPGSILGFSALCTHSRFIYLCGGKLENNSPSNQVLMYDPLTNSFEMLPPMKIKRSHAVAIFYQGYLHVLGGHDGSKQLKSVEKYDPVKKKWLALPSMNELRSFHAVAVLDGKLYACGGVNNDNVEVYDPSTNSWQLGARMKNEKLRFFLVAYDGKLFAVAGDHGTTNTTVQVYDPKKDKWQIDPNLSRGLNISQPTGGFILSSYIPNTD